MAFSDDGQYLVTTATRSATVWKTIFGNEVAQLSHPDTTVGSVAFSPDGKRMVTAAGTSARIWSVADSRELYRLAHDTDVEDVSFTADGQSIVTVTRPAPEGDSKTCVHVWAADSRTQRSRFCQEHSASSLDDNGGHVVLGLDGSMDIRSIADGTRIAGLKDVPHLGFQSAVAVSSRRRHAAAVSGLSSDYELYLVDLGSDAKPTVIAVKGYVRRLAFSADERLLAAASDEAIILWSADDGRELKRVELPRGANSVAFSADGSHLASGGRDQTVRVWQVPSLREVARFELGGNVNAVVFNPDMQLVAAASSDRTARVWRWRSIRLATRVAGSAEI